MCDIAKNKEFLLNGIKGVRRLLAWHSDNSFFIESAATYVTHSIVFVDTNLELTDNEPFYFSNILNGNMKMKAIQLGSVKVEIVV